MEKIPMEWKRECPFKGRAKTFTIEIQELPSGPVMNIPINNPEEKDKYSKDIGNILKPMTKYRIKLASQCEGCISMESATYDYETKEKESNYGYIVIIVILCFIIILLATYIVKPEVFGDLLKKPITEIPDIMLSQFPDIFEKLMENNCAKIVQEYKVIDQYGQKLIDSSLKTQRKAMMPSNLPKNRYRNILPFDENRVILEAEDGESDYINASYIKGYDSKREYISAQGPTQQTSFDFWRMVWQFNCEYIAMLTNLVENKIVKCHQYYPESSGMELKFDDISIKCVEIVNAGNSQYTKRILSIEWRSSTKTVIHFQFKEWPDHGTPQNPCMLINFVKTIREERQSKPSFLLVHCSAGVGRSGTFISLDIMLNKLDNEAKINIFNTVHELRNQRVKMVQGATQYILLYKCANELVQKDPIRHSRLIKKDYIDEATEEIELETLF